MNIYTFCQLLGFALMGVCIFLSAVMIVLLMMHEPVTSLIIITFVVGVWIVGTIGEYALRKCIRY